NLIAPARKHDDRSARILSLRRIDRDRRPRHIAHANRWPPAGKKVFPRRLSVLWPRDTLRIRSRPRPYRYLSMSRRWLPGRLLLAQTVKRKHNTESKEQRLHHNPRRGRIQQDELSSEDRYAPVSIPGCIPIVGHSVKCVTLIEPLNLVQI